MVKYFPKNYSESRERFLRQAIAIANCEIQNWKIPSAKDDDLYVDSAWLPPIEKNERLLVITSGIHGSETYAGSAVQSMFMDQILPTIDRKNMGILIVHSMNPYGFKNHQRTTENKINLNRNFSVSGDLYKIKNSESVQLCKKYLPRVPVSTAQSSFKPSDISMDKFTKITAPGQFDSPEYLEFGGAGPEPQTKKFIQLLQKLMPQFTTVVGLDLHTGLGHRGRLHLLDGGNEKVVNKELFKKLYDPNKDSKYYTVTSSDAEGFYEVKGSINSAYGELAQSHQKVCALTMEYGTLGHSPEQQLIALNDFLVDHQGLNFGFANSEIEKQVKSKNFSRSYPDDDQWRTDILLAAKGLFECVLERINS